MHHWKVGDIIHGFAQGSFGRDSYSCRKVEAVGPDWIVTRNESMEAEFASGERLPSREAGEDLDYCHHGRVEEFDEWRWYDDWR